MGNLYHDLIQQAAPGADPRHVEAYMRLTYPTLDHLDHRTFMREARKAARAAAVDPAEAEELALSFGLHKPAEDTTRASRLLHTALLTAPRVKGQVARASAAITAAAKKLADVSTDDAAVLDALAWVIEGAALEVITPEQVVAEAARRLAQVGIVVTTTPAKRGDPRKRMAGEGPGLRTPAGYEVALPLIFTPAEEAPALIREAGLYDQVLDVCAVRALVRRFKTRLVPPDDVNARTKAALLDLCKAAKRAGWTYQGCVKADTLAEWSFKKGDALVVVGGVHGTGNGGSAASFAAVYHRPTKAAATQSWHAPVYPSGGSLPAMDEEGKLVDATDAAFYRTAVLPAVVQEVKRLLGGA
jgi:hypothetical protein